MMVVRVVQIPGFAGPTCHRHTFEPLRAAWRRTEGDLSAVFADDPWRFYWCELCDRAIP